MVCDKITGIGSIPAARAIAAASTGLVGAADRKACARLWPLIRLMIRAVAKMQATVASAVPTMIGASSASTLRAAGENASPTCVATTI